MRASAWRRAQARQREQEYRARAELAALRAGEEEADVEAQDRGGGAAEQLPAEPALAELPVDPLAPEDVAAPSIDRAGLDEPLPARTPE